MSMTLRQHRINLKKSGDAAYTYEISKEMEKLCKTLAHHLVRAGYTNVTALKNNGSLADIVRCLFDAQGQRPMFHVEGTELPLCWNRPKHWDKDYIKYEWGHLRSQNQNAGNIGGIENLALYSARCNQHIQSSLDLEEIMLYGGIIASRITSVLTSRRQVFSGDCKDIIGKLEGIPVPEAVIEEEKEKTGSI